MTLLAPQTRTRVAPPARASLPAIVPAAIVDETRAFARAWPAALADLEQLDLTALAWVDTRRYGALLRHLLRRGEGFCRLTLPAGHGLDPAERRLLFLALGVAMGAPLTQHRRLHAVHRGAGGRGTALVSGTREQGCVGFHTDSSVKGVLPDFVGLLCEQPALAGGDFLVSDAMRVRAKLSRQAPGALLFLRHEYVHDLATPGVASSLAALYGNRFPVFARDSEPAGWTFRYMRDWLERGQQRAGECLTPEVVAALDLLDQSLASPSQVVGFRLEAGDMLWINNRTVAHDRTAFADDPAAPSLLWRMWVGGPAPVDSSAG